MYLHHIRESDFPDSRKLIYAAAPRSVDSTIIFEVLCTDSSLINNISVIMPKLLLHLFLLLGSTCFAENVFNRNSSFPDSYQEWLDDSNYQHVVYLGIEDNVAVHWTIEDTILNIAVAVKNATGWVGFGIAETGGKFILRIVYCIF